VNFLVVAIDFLPNRGGISTYTKELAGALAKTCQVIVLAPGTSSSSTFDQTFPFRIVRTPAFPLLRITALFLYIPWLVWRYRIDAVLHTVWPTALISHLWYYLLPTPYFVSVHASEILDDRVTWRRRFKGYLKPWRQAALEKAKGIFPVSRYSAGLVIDLGIEKNRIQVITNGVDPERFKPVTTYKSGDGQKTLLTVARLDLHKGHDRVLEALAILKEEGFRPHYNIVGEGEEETRLRRLAQNLGLESQVTFTGFIPDNQLPDIYAESDIFIMPSREIPGRADLVEGFGISLLEASASGLPVVAGRSGGVADAVLDGETGVLVDPDDPQSIAHALKLLLKDNEFARQLGKKGRQWSETQMSWERAAERLLNAVERLM
jgi:phosphatidylinositol alpha-1,6-mannosyltransferase